MKTQKKKTLWLAKIFLVFLMIFSQLHLPIVVFAEELGNTNEETTTEENNSSEKENTTAGDSNEETTTEEENQSSEETNNEQETSNEEEPTIKVTINEEETTSYTLKDEETEVKVKITYGDATKEETIDLSEEKVGDHEYEYSIEDSNNHSTTVTITITKKAKFGDYNSDGIIDENDQKELANKLLEDEVDQTVAKDYDINADGVFDILDVTHHGFKDGNWENKTTELDELHNIFSNKSIIYTGEELVVEYSINGLKENKLTGLSGTLNYNKELLEISNVQFNADGIFINNNDKLAFILNDYQSDEIFMTITFKALKEGDANISFDDIIASIGGEKANLDDSIFTTVAILENAKGGDVEEEPATETKEESTEESEKVETPAVETVPQPMAITVTPASRVVYLSSDNLIKSLEIKGYDIKFDSNTLEYSLKVKNSVTSLDLTVLLNDSNASYTVTGNENFKVGENVVEIIVKAEDGSTRTYKINVTREKATTKKEEKETEEKEKSSSKVVIIVLIILVIIGLIYVIFKDDEEDN